jgi:hypothetical protein
MVAPSTTRRLIGRFLPHLPATDGPPPDLAALMAEILRRLPAPPAGA